jgi:hypothetical protein
MHSEISRPGTGKKLESKHIPRLLGKFKKSFNRSKVEVACFFRFYDHVYKISFLCLPYAKK